MIAEFRLWLTRSLGLLMFLWACSYAQAKNATEQVRLAQLPVEVAQTLHLIRQGGPFPFPRDGIVFGNYERQLPRQKRGFYREYTVITPGLKNRGARRLVVGGEPGTSKLIYYSEDHYQSFRFVLE